jgi:hypothetical protein
MQTTRFRAGQPFSLVNLEAWQPSAARGLTYPCRFIQEWFIGQATRSFALSSPGASIEAMSVI